MRPTNFAAFAAALTILGLPAAMAAPHCYTSYGGTKPNKVYLRGGSAC
jgi:hypothetical protein